MNRSFLDKNRKNLPLTVRILHSPNLPVMSSFSLAFILSTSMANSSRDKLTSQVLESPTLYFIVFESRDILVETNSLNLQLHSHLQGVEGTVVDDGEVMADFVIVVARVSLIVPDDIVVAGALYTFHIIVVSEL